MIKRIVRMSFEPDKLSDFLEIFYAAKPLIEQMNGCHSVVLFQEANKSNILYTESYWESENDLENYRNSALFQETWTKTKILFNDKPQAFSLIALEKNTYDNSTQ
jgi:heme-degrading monooxygenase HmoA